jgi:uncharacterized protein YecE (DUF72 family)
MNFGWLPPEKLDGLDLSPPPDPPANVAVLARASRALGAPPRAYVGLAEWRVREWVGRLYPAKAKEVLWMDHYIANYNCLEFNATHYRIYTPDEVRRWAGKAIDRDFLFLPKLLQWITHDSGFNGAEEVTAQFLEGVAAFGEHLGPVFLQLPEAFAPYPAARRALFRYLATLPNEQRFFLELRHPGWFADRAVRAELFTALRDMRIGALITDTPGRRDVCHMELSLPEVFIRFVAKSRHPTTYARIDAWAARLKAWLDAGLESFYFIVHTGQSAPETSLYVVDALNRTCGLNIRSPHPAAPDFNPFDDVRR